jgi:uncharacterized protein with ParB-like and HNH nuclease domain
MNQFKTDKGVFTPGDFAIWQSNELLVLTPKFQRNPVWRPGAKSLFIDTILRGMTTPPIYLRMAQSKEKKKVVREVVDGQQRIRCLLDFMNNEFKLSRSLENAGEWAGKSFKQLTPANQDRIVTYSLSTETFPGISDEDILDVFCRLNANSMPLNRQELRNGKFFGPFKQTARALGREFLSFWRTNKIFTEQAIARMLEIELVSELLIASEEGMQDKKKSIDGYYKQWEKTYPTHDRDRKRFVEVMDTLADSVPAESLASSHFHRPPLFYTLYCVVHHHMFGLPKIQRISPKKKLTESSRSDLCDAVLMLSSQIDEWKLNEEEVQPRYAKFSAACAQQTDNIIPRRVRFDSLYEEAFT